MKTNCSTTNRFNVSFAQISEQIILYIMCSYCIEIRKTNQCIDLSTVIDMFLQPWSIRVINRCFVLIGAKNISFDFGKTAPRKRKVEMHAREQGLERKSTLSVRYSARLNVLELSDKSRSTTGNLET
jgi:hypothetical protein